MTLLTPELLPRVQAALADEGLDGWLLFDFHGVNPIASGLLGIEGFVTRRIFGWVPREGTPVAVTHAIEQDAWRRWPGAWRRVRYSGWRELERTIGELVSGKRVAMEYSPGDAVPYLDRVPAGVLDLVRQAGADVVSSSELVTAFYATWTRDQLASHRRAAEVVAEIGRSSIAHAGAEARAGRAMTEHALQQWIVDRFRERGLAWGHPPIVGVDANAANPHYEPPADGSAVIAPGSILLVDLWAHEPDRADESTVYADQTWMGSLGEPSRRALEVWAAVRDARDAAIALVRERVEASRVVRGAEVDDAARAVIESRGMGERFVHRTGHSIDSRDLHGAGPHIDNLETREERQLAGGVAFSVEPGVYIPGEIGMRSEVNVYVGGGEVIVTPVEIQRELIVV